MKRNVILLLLSFYLTVVNSSAQYGAPTTAAAWTTRANMPVSYRDNSASTIYNNELYVFGGDHNLEAFKYNPTSNIWTPLANLPNGTYEGGAVTLGSYIYVFHSPFSENVQRYNPANNTWTTLSACPNALRGRSYLAYNNLIYAIGGANGGLIYQTTVDIYNPATDAWTTSAYPMPVAKGFASAVTYNNKFYILGGLSNSSGGFGDFTVYEFNPSTNAWTQKTSCTAFNRSLNKAFLYGNKIYVVGGLDNNWNYSNDIMEYNPATDTWAWTLTCVPDLTSVHSYAGGIIGNKIYIAGGINSVNSTNLNETKEITLSTAGVITTNYNSSQGSTLQSNSNNSYLLQTSATVTARTSPGFSFANWTENNVIVHTDSVYTFLVTGNRTLTANFVASQTPVNNCSFIAISQGNGSVSITGYPSNNITTTCGSQLTVVGTPAANYVFDYWLDYDGNIVSTNPTYNFTLSNTTVLLNGYFRPSVTNSTISLSANPTMGGTVSGAGTFANGSSRTVTATANANFTFVNWTESGSVVSTSSSYNFTLTANRNLVANFSPVVNNCSFIAVSQGNGSVSITGYPSNNITTTCGSQLTVVGTPAANYVFDYWLDYDGNIVSTNPTYSFALADTTILLNGYFRPSVNNCTLSAQSTGNGTVSISGFGSNNITTTCGSTVTVTATPSTGYTFDFWLDYDGNTVSQNPTHSFTLSNNSYLYSYFKPQEYTISAIASPTQGGRVYFTGEYNHGDNVTLMAVPNAGYNFVRWQHTTSGQTVGTSTSLSFTAASNADFTAIFQAQPTNSTLRINGTTPSPTIGVQSTTNFAFQANVPNASSFANLQVKVIFSAPDGVNYEFAMTPQGNGNFTHTRTLQQMGRYNVQFQAISNSETANSLSYQVTVQRACNPNPINDYPYSQCSNCVDFFCTSDGIADSWSMYRHQCTSWVMWRLNGATNNTTYRNNMFGTVGTSTVCMPSISTIATQRLANACRWAGIFAANGVTVDQNAAVGAIAHWDANENGTRGAGHVAYVECVNGTEVTISEFNWIACSFGTRVIRTDLPNSATNRKPGRYIHVEVDGLGSGDYGADTSIISVARFSQMLPFQLYPNPSNGLVNLVGLDAQEEYSLSVVNALGQEVLRKNIRNEENQEIDLSTLSNGLYFVNLQSGEQTKTVKLILQH
jgi:N-acetylneuraminic acid mutarotase/surface antigen